MKQKVKSLEQMKLNLWSYYDHEPKIHMQYLTVNTNKLNNLLSPSLFHLMFSKKKFVTCRPYQL
jgi:hypothetical protein